MKQDPEQPRCRRDIEVIRRERAVIRDVVAEQVRAVGRERGEPVDASDPEVRDRVVGYILTHPREILAELQDDVDPEGDA